MWNWEPAQLDFSLSVVTQFGYDTDRGRLDKTHHPFCAKFSGGDVRITTRVDEKHFGDALFSAMHEAGHALYEQGVAAALEGTPLGSAVGPAPAGARAAMAARRTLAWSMPSATYGVHVDARRIVRVGRCCPSSRREESRAQTRSFNYRIRGSDHALVAE